ncbi:MAG TPA: 4'-phosphopantetheinyl transferase superfamily protein [Vicinamibacterales bacterium]|nr:4'-phosphopantetheinyl transferase superfamily protein [Vicinamibacterales bacterium]
MTHADAYFSATSALDESQSEALVHLLSPAERERHDRLRQAHDKRDYAAAHVLLRMVLAAHTQTRPEELTFTADRRGKPLLVQGDGGIPPSFSLAHSRGLVACAIATEGSVGIDVEPVNDVVDAVGIARRFFAAEEAATLDRCAAEARPSRFCELWTLKEALLKATGTGLAAPLDSVSFQVDGPNVSVTFTPTPALPPLAPASWTFTLMNVGGGTHKLAVALDAPGHRRPRVCVTEVDLPSMLIAPTGSGPVRRAAR